MSLTLTRLSTAALTTLTGCARSGMALPSSASSCRITSWDTCEWWIESLSISFNFYKNLIRRYCSMNSRQNWPKQKVSFFFFKFRNLQYSQTVRCTFSCQLYMYLVENNETWCRASFHAQTCLLRLIQKTVAIESAFTSHFWRCPFSFLSCSFVPLSKVII